MYSEELLFHEIWQKSSRAKNHTWLSAEQTRPTQTRLARARKDIRKRRNRLDREVEDAKGMRGGTRLTTESIYPGLDFKGWMEVARIEEGWMNLGWTWMEADVSDLAPP